MKNPVAKRGFFGGSRRTLLLFGFGFVFISSSPPESTEDATAGGRVIGVVPIAFEMESNGRNGRETGKDGLRRGGRAVGIVIGVARACADWVFEIVEPRACLVGKGVNMGVGGESGSVLEPLESRSDVSSWKRNAEDDEAKEEPEESGDWVSGGVTGDKVDEESLLVLVQRSLLLLEGSYDELGGFTEVLRGGRREVTAGANTRGH